MKEERRLTIKQRNFLNEYLISGNATDAAMKVYDCKDRASASQVGYENLRKLEILDEVDFWLNKFGVTDSKLAKTIKEGLDATKVISAVSQKDADEKTMDFIDVPDWSARNKVLELILKMRGKLVERNINLNIYEGAGKFRDIIEEERKRRGIE